jgi:uncharacterized protein
MIWLTLAFFVTALLYATVGFGGGSTYSAVLALVKTKVALIPVIGPLCNVIVSSGGTARYVRAGLMPWRKILPLALVAAPFALLGGLTPIKEIVFLSLLAVSLAVAGLTLLVQHPPSDIAGTIGRSSAAQYRDLVVSAAIGYLAGLVGLGGGIFLAPYLHFTRWAAPKQIAASAALYILINSTAGLVGQFWKLRGDSVLSEVTAYWPLAVAVLIGGQIGSIIGIKWVSPPLIRRATGALILFVAAQLAWKLVHG